MKFGKCKENCVCVENSEMSSGFWAYCGVCGDVNLFNKESKKKINEIKQ